MAELIANRYRTRFPPKEHEEAVKMLLEGVEKQQIEDSINNRRSRTQTAAAAIDSKRRQMKTPASTARARLQPDERSLDDRKSLNSSNATETNSSGIVECYNGEEDCDSHLVSGETGLAPAGVQSRSTSTSESISTKSGASNVTDELLQSQPNGSIESGGDLIPSRTIAVQCDLKGSSVKTRDVMFDTSMQASSISSTRYGFYNYNHETLAKRHRLQRSTSYRNNLDSVGSFDEADSSLKMSNRGCPKQRQFSTEAPTSMSELSESEAASRASCAEESVPPRTVRSEAIDRHAREPSSCENGRLDGSESSHEVRRLSREPQQVLRLSLRGRQMYGSVMDNSLGSSTARARIDSLPRRPMTALSYVSANKLRHDSVEASSDDDDERPAVGEKRRRSVGRPRIINSASHTNLVARAKTPSTQAEQYQRHQLSSSSNASSDSELTSGHRMTRRSQHTQQARLESDRPNNYTNRHASNENRRPVDDDDDDDEENQHSEEMILLNETTRSSHRMPPPVVKGQLVESRHQEDVQDLNGVLEQFRQAESDLRNNGYATRERYSTLRPAANDASSLEKSAVSSTMSLPRKATRRSQKLEQGDDTMRRRQPEVSTPADSRVTYTTASERDHSSQSMARQQQPQVGRSISMRQSSGNRPSTIAMRRNADERPQQQQQPSDEEAARYRLKTTNTLTRDRSQTLQRPSRTWVDSRRLVDEDDSDALASKTWANPAQGVSFDRRRGLPAESDLQQQQQQRLTNAATRRVASRSMSMRDVNVEPPPAARRGGLDADGLYTPYRPNNNFTAKYNDEYSSSESSDLVANENAVRNLAARLSPLDYDSQQRLNESGLPEVNTLGSSYQHQYHHASQDGLQRHQQQQPSNRYTSNTLMGQRGHIRGRAMSQQSLSRPTMPLSTSGGRRWQQAAGGPQSASSDVGGSSMSLATRLQGRYESAHTRSPIVMYIPPASSSRAGSLKGEDSLLGGSGSGASRLQRSSLKRVGSRSPRSRSRHGSQDRSTVLSGARRQRSTSKNGSDSETSSILRTLVRARGSRGAESAYSSKRIARLQNVPVNNIIDTDDEHMDGVGRLATEVDSYKFIRRYSVPKDAKINWFSRLRQRVASANR